MKKLLVFIVVIVATIAMLIFLSACSQSEKKESLTEYAQLAKSDLEKRGYEIVEFKGEKVVSFEREELLESPYQDMWGVQTMAPDPYIGRDITLAHFLVRNHPLDDQFEMGQTNVFVMLLEGEVIGGTSFPDSKEPLVGGSYSLDGKAAEEVHPDYESWRAEWEAKYGG